MKLEKANIIVTTEINGELETIKIIVDEKGTRAYSKKLDDRGFKLWFKSDENIYQPMFGAVGALVVDNFLSAEV